MACYDGFGTLHDGRPFWVGDFNGNGRADILFYYPGDRNWWLGSHGGPGGTLQWSLAGNTLGKFSGQPNLPKVAPRFIVDSSLAAYCDCSIAAKRWSEP